MNVFALASAALLAAAAVAPAHAVTLQYTLTGNDLDGTVEFASFRLDANPVVLPNNVGPDEGFRLKFVSGTFQYGAILSSLQDVLFYNAALGGGFGNLDPADKIGDTGFIVTVGPQLYSGSEASPTLLAGDFTVFDAFSGAPLDLSVAAVPEPATWAMLTIGFGAVGFAMRRRRTGAVAHSVGRASRRASTGRPARQGRQ